MATEYIKTVDALNGIYNCPTKTDADGYIWVRTIDVAHMVDDLPAADVRSVVRGDWIIDRAFGNDVMSGGQMVICSACNKGIFYGKQNFCPNCGADMREN